MRYIQENLFCVTVKLNELNLLLKFFPEKMSTYYDVFYAFNVLNFHTLISYTHILK